MICPECKSKFTYLNRIKSIFNKDYMIKCEHCKKVFIRKKNSGRISYAIFSGILTFIVLLIAPSFSHNFKNPILIIPLISGLIVSILSFIFLFISQNWCKYEIYKDNLEK